MRKNQTGSSLVIIMLSLAILISVVSYAGFRVHERRVREREQANIAKIDQKRPIVQSEVESLISSINFTGGKLIASSKVDACYEQDVFNGDFKTGSQHECYYRRQLIVAYPAPIEGTIETVTNLAREIGFVFDTATPGEGFDLYPEDHCSDLYYDKWTGPQYMQSSMSIFDLSQPYYDQYCAALIGDQIYSDNQTYKTQANFTTKDTFDKSAIQSMASQIGAKTLLVITLHDPIGFY